MPDTDAERLVDLEVRLAFQDKLIADLDQFVRALSQRLEQAERELTQLKASVASPQHPMGPADEPPPHY